MGAAPPDLVARLRADLDEEGEALAALLAPLPPAAWDTLTPARPWSIRDSIVHLHRTDEAGLVAVTSPDRFRADVDAIRRAAVRPEYGGGTGDLLAGWRATAAALSAAVAAAPAGEPIVWFGPPMSRASFLTARLMETWAHGQDVADALGAARPATERLRHIADLGVRTRRWAYANRRLAVPDTPVRVELLGPGGGTWGPPEPADSAPAERVDAVTGTALDFCLLVTQRRHRGDVALTASGAAADEWLDIAQAFAGPPTATEPGRGVDAQDGP